MSPEPASIRLGLETFEIGVTSRDEATLAWLREFLAPAFGSGSGTPDAPAARVSFEVSPDRHGALAREMAEAPERALEGFTLDGSFTRHRSWRADDGCTWAYDDHGDAFHGVTDGGRRVTVVVKEGEVYPRVALMRVVRELATTALLRAGRLPLHASAFVADGDAVLICGPKRAGKTSLLVHALRCGASFLSNDRVFTGPESPPVARPMPTIVMLRNGTLALFDELRGAFESARFDRGRTLDECAPGVERPEPRAGPGKDRPGISPIQLCRLLGSGMRGAAPVGAILLPTLDEGARGVELAPVTPEQAARSLGRSLLEPSSPARFSPLFAPDAAGEEIPPALQARRCLELARRARTWACRLGPDAYASDLLATLRAAGVTGPGARPGSRPAPRAH